jgi:HD-like signal output (HDOD) protein/ActR/RegA family two-component response regulator
MQAVEADQGVREPEQSITQRVLFVDDEPHLLAGLRRMLRPERSRWDMSFVSSAAEALDLMAGQRMDAVVSDMRMPGMNGAELLAQVQRNSPATARIILSGQADLDSVLAVLRSAQQFLAKPCDVATLVGAVDQALKVQRMLTDPTLRELIGGVVSLPSLPIVYHQLVSLMDSPEVDLMALAGVVGSDVATSAELLRLVNSAFFGLSREVATVESAVSLLGLDNIQALVLTGSVFRSGEAPAQVVEVELLRELALRRAAIARAIAALVGWPQHERNLSVLACMLRDVGGLVLAEGMPGPAAGLAEALAEEGFPPDPAYRAKLELAAFGCTVPQASAYLLGLWGFAPAVVHTIASQPLVTVGPATTQFEQVLGFAHLRVLNPFEPVALAPSEHLSAERLASWNTAAEEVIKP